MVFYIFADQNMDTLPIKFAIRYSISGNKIGM